MNNVVHLPGAAPEQSLLEQYLSYMRIMRAESTARTYGEVLRPFLSWLKTQPGGGELHSVLVAEYLKHLTREGKGNATRRKVLAAIRSYVAWLTDRGQLKIDPTRGVATPPPAAATPRELTDFERKLAKICVSRAGTKRAAVVLWLAYGAGLRLAEVAALPEAHVHVGERHGRIRIVGKGGKERTISLTAETRRAVYEYLQSNERYPSDSPFLITPERKVGRGRIQPRALEKAWEGIKALCTERDFQSQSDSEQARKRFLTIRYHDLRHDYLARVKQNRTCCPKCGHRLDEIDTETACADSSPPNAK